MAINHDTHEPSMDSKPKEFIIAAKIKPQLHPWTAIHLSSLHFEEEVSVSQPELCFLEVRSLKQDSTRKKKKEMNEKVTSWVKLTRLGTASR